MNNLRSNRVQLKVDMTAYSKHSNNRTKSTTLAAVPIIRRTFKYRLYPTHEQEHSLRQTLFLCKEFYNAALMERKEAYRMCGVSMNYHHQSADLPECKEVYPELFTVHSQVLQNVLRRVDLAYTAFFRRVELGIKPGHPRYHKSGRYNSFTFPQYGSGVELYHTTGSTKWMIRLSKIGNVKVRVHRALMGTPKTVTVRREIDQWYVCISCIVPVILPAPEPITRDSRVVGVDMGLTHYATLSTGEKIDNPRWNRKAQDKLAATQQALALYKKGSHTRKRHSRAIARIHRHIKRQRADFQHKLALRLVREYDLIVVEDLQIDNMAKRVKPKLDEGATLEQGQRVYAPNGQSRKSGLNKSIMDAGWGQFIGYLMNKAEWAGRHVMKQTPHYTSQKCSGCSVLVPKELSQRWHQCPSCGLVMDRDENAARNILGYALTRLAVTATDPIVGDDALVMISKRAGSAPRTDKTVRRSHWL